MDDPHEAYDWTVVYCLTETKRGGAFGRAYTLDRAIARINGVLASLSDKAGEVRGELVLMGERRCLDRERFPICVLAKIEDRELTWIHSRVSRGPRDVHKGRARQRR